MVDRRSAFLSYAERNVAHHVVHNLFHGRRDLGARGISPDRKIAAGDIKSDTGKRNLVRVGDYATDRLGISFVAVRAQHRPFAARFHASLDLRDRRGVMFAEDFGPHGINWRSVITRHASTSLRDLISAGLRTAF